MDAEKETPKEHICDCICHTKFVVHGIPCCYDCKICSEKIKAEKWFEHNAFHDITA